MVQRRHSTGGERNVSDKETPESSTKIISISNANILCARGGMGQQEQIAGWTESRFFKMRWSYSATASAMWFFLHPGGGGKRVLDARCTTSNLPLITVAAVCRCCRGMRGEHWRAELCHSAKQVTPALQRDTAQQRQHSAFNPTGVDIQPPLPRPADTSQVLPPHHGCPPTPSKTNCTYGYTYILLHGHASALIHPPPFPKHQPHPLPHWLPCPPPLT
jgi:hypothetical protein